jgi:hypothetical protein
MIGVAQCILIDDLCHCQIDAAAFPKPVQLDDFK